MKPNIAIELFYLSDCGFWIRGNSYRHTILDWGEIIKIKNSLINIILCLSQLNIIYIIKPALYATKYDSNQRYKT